VGDEDPVLATFLHPIDDDRVARAHAVPARGAHDVAVTGHLGTWFHTSFLVGGSVVT
jgi:hypothetical protein